MTDTPPRPEPPTDPPHDDDGSPVPAGDDLALPPETACRLVSEHGGEIVILDDGRVVFMNASEHLIELAHAIAPEDEEIAERMRRLEEVRRRRGGESSPSATA